MDVRIAGPDYNGSVAVRVDESAVAGAPATPRVGQY